MSDKYDIIFKTRNDSLKERDTIWTLILNAYKGGIYFLNGNYLIQYPKESNNSFSKRKDRAVYFNQLSPIVDMVSGMLYNEDPVRTIPKSLTYLLDSVSSNKTMNEFMRLVAAYSFMFTVGVLVTTPEFDSEMISTEKDRKDNKINPYAVLYLPEHIRDFYISPVDGKLEWVLLDDSFYDHYDILTTKKEITRYTLWDREKYQSFERDKDSNVTIENEPVYHKVGYVPFRFVSWRDDNSDFIAETVCEDIAMISKLIYNNMSYMDEMLASGTFKMLTYPSKDGSVPANMESGGVGALSIIPYDIASSNVPSFIGAELAEIDPFIKAIEFYMSEILKKVGLSTDETKKFVKSGMAKRIDMQKMRALLISGSQMMGKTEEWIFETASNWINSSSPGDIKIEYNAKFDDDDLYSEITVLMELLAYPIQKLQKNVMSLITKKMLGEELTPDELQGIYTEIESFFSGELGENFNAKDAANQINDKQQNNREQE